MANIIRKLTALVLVCAFAASCSTQSPRSIYFIVAFLPGTPAPSQEGVEGLGSAVNQVERSRPAFIVIDGVEPESGGSAGLERSRAQAIVDAFVRSGIDLRTIRTDLHHADKQAYGARKDTLLIQLGYGESSH